MCHLLQSDSNLLFTFSHQLWTVECSTVDLAHLDGIIGECGKLLHWAFSQILEPHLHVPAAGICVFIGKVFACPSKWKILLLEMAAGLEA